MWMWREGRGVIECGGGGGGGGIFLYVCKG